MGRKPANTDHPQCLPDDEVSAYKYSAKRKNNPPAGLESQGSFQEARKIRYDTITIRICRPC